MTLAHTPALTHEGTEPRAGSAPYTIGSVLLILALALAVSVAWSRPGAQGYYDLNRASTLLHEARFTEATALLEHTLLTYNPPQTRISLSQAYLARRDPDYLLWLSRHSSGIRYRTEIYGILRTMGVSSAA